MSSPHSLLSTTICGLNFVLWHLGLSKVGSLITKVTDKLLSEEEVASDLCHRYFQAYSKVCHTISEAEKELAEWRSEGSDEPLSREDVLYLVSQVEGLQLASSWYPHDFLFQRRVGRLYMDIKEFMKERLPGFADALRAPR
tara:strand:- start:3704 stop:4126 length:423 start_codon:yes stop_codon:yes gene_type:complete